jgi:ABC-type amino acid transport substrate-binding protein
MKNRESILIFVLCLIASAALPFGRGYIFRSPLIPTPLLPAMPSGMSDGVITIHYHERVPYYYLEETGKVVGICADPAGLAFEKSGILYRWLKTPAKRQLLIIKENRAEDCILGWFKSPEREAFAKFTLPIYQDMPSIAIARSDNTTITSDGSIEDILSNPKLTLLRKDGYSYGQFVDEKIAQINPNQVMTSAENTEMLIMIHYKRADYFLIAQEEAAWLIRSSGIPEADFKLVAFSNMPAGSKRYILCSQKVSDDLIEKINASIIKYVHSGPGALK